MDDEYPSWTVQTRSLTDPVYFAENILMVKGLFPEWKKVLWEFYSVDKDGEPKYRELVANVGMGSGKTYVTGIICGFEFYQLLNMPNPQMHWNLSPETPLNIVNCAKSADQAKKTIFAFIKGFMLDAPYFKSLIDTGVMTPRHDEFEHVDKKIFLKSEHSASGSLAGKSSKCVCLDELAKFDFTASGESAADEVYAITTKATGRFGMDGKMISISSPISTDDLFWRLVERGKANPHLRMLVIDKPTWDMVDLTIKPEYAFDSAMMTAEREKDFDKFMRDYGAKPVGRLVPFFPDVDPIRACARGRSPVRMTTDGPVLEEWFKPSNYIHVIAGDPALKRDAFGLAMAHMENNRIICDFTMKFERILPQKEIDTRQVKAFIMSVLDRGFAVRMFITDIRSYPELFQDLARRGVVVEQSFVKKETYDYLKERINLDEIQWPMNDDLFDELSHLEIISQRKVDHPKYGSKDIADAVANAAFFIKDMQTQPPAWVIKDHW